MRTHRLTAAIVSLILLSTPAGAMAVPADLTYPRAVPPTTGPTPSDFAPAGGDTKSDLGTAVVATPTTGDTKFDAPGATRAPVYDPPATIQVVQPERTIVRDVNEELPVILAGLALLVALSAGGFALLRTRHAVIGR
jgi:hypothetical protein